MVCDAGVEGVVAAEAGSRVFAAVHPCERGHLEAVAAGWLRHGLAFGSLMDERRPCTLAWPLKSPPSCPLSVPALKLQGLTQGWPGGLSPWQGTSLEASFTEAKARATWPSCVLSKDGCLANCLAMQPAPQKPEVAHPPQADQHGSRRLATPRDRLAARPKGALQFTLELHQDVVDHGSRQTTAVVGPHAGGL